MGTIAFPNVPADAQAISQAPQNALAEYARVAQVKQQTAEEAQQQQGMALANQEKQRELTDQDAFTKTLATFDPSKNTVADIPKMITANGGSGKAALAAQQGLIQQKQNLLKLSDDQFTQQQKQADLMQGVHDEVTQAPPEQKNAVYQAGLQRLAASGVDVSKEPTEYPGDEVFSQHLAPIQLHSASVADAAKQREADKNAAQARQANAQAAHQEFVNNLTKSSKPGDFDKQIDAIVPIDPKNPQSLPQNQFVKAQVNGFLSRGDLQNANHAIEQAYQNTLGVQKDIAVGTNPQIQAGKVQVAAAEGAARQNAINNPAPIGNPSLSGAAYVKSLPPPMQDLVTQIGSGKMALNRLDYLLSKNPQLMAAVSQAYPDFDSSKVKSYTDTYKDFTSGPTSKALNAGGTGLGHLSELQDLNTPASHIPHTPAWTAYQNKATTVATELAKFYGDATVSGIDAIKQTLVSTLPGNREAAIETQAKSMGDKLDAYEQQWKNAAPSAAYQAPLPGISPQAKAARAKLDPEYAAKVQGQGGAAQPQFKIGDFFSQFGGKKR